MGIYACAVTKRRPTIADTQKAGIIVCPQPETRK